MDKVLYERRLFCPAFFVHKSMSQTLSIIIPIHNEAGNIGRLYDDVVSMWEKNCKDYDLEILFINDGSTDESMQRLDTLSEKDKRIAVIDFTRNFGHQAALEAGLAYASGDAVVMMDGDLQHPPSVIPVLIEKWRAGAKIVNTRRKDAKRTGLLKRITSKGFYLIFNKISTTHIDPGFADFRLIDRSVADLLKTLPEKHKFYRALVNWTGHETAVVEYDAPARTNGSSSYNWGKMMTLARVGITSFSMKPMKIILMIGSLVTIGSLLLLIFMTGYRWFVDIRYFSPLSFVVVFIVFNTGFILMCQGIIATYLVNISESVQKRPNYVVKKIINIKNKSA